MKLVRDVLQKIQRRKLSKSNIFGPTNIFGRGVMLASTKWGHNSVCNDRCDISSTVIGNYCGMGAEVIIGPRNHIFSNFTARDFPYTNNEHAYSVGDGIFDGYFNKIGNDCWIGRRSIIVQGVEVGNGAVIAAGSIVTKSVPPYAIVAGNPAKIVRYRFTKQQIKSLEESRWFDLSVEEALKIKDELSAMVDFDVSSLKTKAFRKKDLEE